MQKPSIGRIVIVPADPAINNGADQAPAIVVRAWERYGDGPQLVNVHVLLDGEGVQWRTSVELLDERPENFAGRHIAWWPPRV